MERSDPVLDRAAVRAADTRAIKQLGVPGPLLMENAGRGLADVTQEETMRCGLASVLVVAGRGNNGGDGLVAARHLHLRGQSVAVALLFDPAELDPSGDPALNLRILRHLPVPIEVAADRDDLRRIAAARPSPVVVVDAVLGTGLAGRVRGRAAEALAWMRDAGHAVVAADIPSGLDADTGEEHGPVPRCRATATFLARKHGLDRGSGPECCGRVVVCDIGVPVEAVTG